MAGTDAKIDALLTELRDDFGVLMTKGRILDAAVNNKNMLEVGGRIVASAKGTPFFGERLQYRAELDHLQPGQTVTYAWRGKAGGRQFRFLVGSSASSDRSKLSVLELDDLFWGAFGGPPAIHKAGGMEVLCHIFLGGSKTPATTLTTGFVKFSKHVPDKLQIIGAPKRTVKGARGQFRVGPWVPHHAKHAISWFVGGKKVASDLPVLTHTFSKTGTFQVQAKVSNVKRNFGFGGKTGDFRDAEPISIEVLSADAFGETFMDELKTSPFRPKTPQLDELAVSTQQSIKDLETKVAKGGSQQEYWEKRLEAQKKAASQTQRARTRQRFGPRPAHRCGSDRQR